MADRKHFRAAPYLHVRLDMQQLTSQAQRRGSTQAWVSSHLSLFQMFTQSGASWRNIGSFIHSNPFIFCPVTQPPTFIWQFPDRHKFPHLAIPTLSEVSFTRSRGQNTATLEDLANTPLIQQQYLLLISTRHTWQLPIRSRFHSFISTTAKFLEYLNHSFIIHRSHLI
jgi:hypothetical protein